jgi:chromosomal replication initiator protein
MKTTEQATEQKLLNFLKDTNEKWELGFTEAGLGFIVNEYLKQSSKEANNILLAVSKYFDIPVSFIQGKGRVASISKPRQLAMYFIKQKTDLSKSAVGSLFGLKHCDVIYAIKTVGNLCETDKEYKKMFDELNKYINGN